MGTFLNVAEPACLYKDIVNSIYFVDKTALLDELIPLMDNQSMSHLPEEQESSALNEKAHGNKYVCVTRPGNFGKSNNAFMIAAYLGKGISTENLFDRLEVHTRSWYKSHLNQHNVFFINMSSSPDGRFTYSEYISFIEEMMIIDLNSAFPDVSLNEEWHVWDMMDYISKHAKGEVKFVFILDEWDYIFLNSSFTETDRKQYMEFLKNLFVDKEYVELVYMTGVLPIAKYLADSELNVFSEYTMASDEKFCEYFGYIENEANKLFEKYQSINKEPKITRDALRNSYEGYGTAKGFRVYNPRSVLDALMENTLINCWTIGPTREIFSYIKHNAEEFREDLVRLIAGIPIPAKCDEYTASSMNISTKEELYSAMVVYGYLSCENGYLRIPNHELMKEFKEMMMKEDLTLGYVQQLSVISERILDATLRGDSETVAKILAFAHDKEACLFNYDNEFDLAALINLVYLSARNSYRIEREDRSGKGFVDFIFYPKNDFSADGFILEVTFNHTAKHAVKQIKDRQYIRNFENTGRILGVGIAYSKKKKSYTCKIEVLRDSIRKYA